MSLNLLGNEETIESTSLEILRLSKELMLEYFQMKAHHYGFKFSCTEVNDAIVETSGRLTEAYKSNVNFLKATKPEQVSCFTDILSATFADILGPK